VGRIQRRRRSQGRGERGCIRLHRVFRVDAGHSRTMTAARMLGCRRLLGLLLPPLSSPVARALLGFTGALGVLGGKLVDWPGRALLAVVLVWDVAGGNLHAHRVLPHAAFVTLDCESVVIACE